MCLCGFVVCSQQLGSCLLAINFMDFFNKPAVSNLFLFLLLQLLSELEQLSWDTFFNKEK